MKTKVSIAQTSVLALDLRLLAFFQRRLVNFKPNNRASHTSPYIAPPFSVMRGFDRIGTKFGRRRPTSAIVSLRWRTERHARQQMRAADRDLPRPVGRIALMAQVRGERL
jgi:hypothetical protein